MKKTFISGIAALSLATGSAHAQWRTDPPLRTDCRHGQLEMYFELNDSPNTEIFENEGHVTVRIDYDAFRKLLKDLPTAIRAFKACDAYRKCLMDQAAGKVKHCYENDHRWREFFTGAW
jgi:hypothetical protein